MCPDLKYERELDMAEREKERQQDVKNVLQIIDKCLKCNVVS